MNMSIIAILISFAMMLTGVGGEGQPAEASRMLQIHNVSVTYNDETVTLDPALWLAAYSNGEKAVFDLGVQADGDTLFPVQLGVDESGITTLFKTSDVAVKVTANALDGLNEQLNGMMEEAQNQMAEGENAELINYMMNEYIPAYTGLLEAVQDPEYMQQLQAKANEVALSILDRGEGTPVTETYDGQDYALTEYHYTVESDKMAQLIDAIYASDEKLAAYYDAMFKMYGMMPEESGLNGIASFGDMFEKMNINMTMDITEKVSDDGEVDFTEATLTLDMNEMMKAMTAAQDGADETASSEVPELPPMEVQIAGYKVGENQDATAAFNYEIEGTGMEMNMVASGKGTDETHMQMNMTIRQDGAEVGSVYMIVDAAKDEATGDENCNANFGFFADDSSADFSVDSACKDSGESTSTFACEVNADGNRFGLSFIADVVNGSLSDEANGHEAAVTLDDLSEEALSGLGEDQAMQAALMQVVGSMSADSQKLMANESVQKLVALFGAMSNSGTAEPEPIDGGEVEDYADDSFEGEEMDDYEYQEPVDDGELGYDVPEFTWLPEGWSLQSTEQDTQYDYVSMSFGTDDYSQSFYATFFKNEDSTSINYVVGANGDIEAVDGREITVTDFGEGSVSVSLHEDNLDGNLNFFGEGIDVETIGKIVAGIQY